MVTGTAPPYAKLDGSGETINGEEHSIVNHGNKSRWEEQFRVHLAKMEKYLAPEAIGEGDISDQWKQFKREFAQFLVAVDKGKAIEEAKLAIFFENSEVNDLVEMM